MTRGLTLQINDIFSKWGTVGNISAKTEDICYRAEKGPTGHTTPTPSPTHPQPLPFPSAYKKFWVANTCNFKGLAIAIQ